MKIYYWNRPTKRRLLWEIGWAGEESFTKINLKIGSIERDIDNIDNRSGRCSQFVTIYIADDFQKVINVTSWFSLNEKTKSRTTPNQNQKVLSLLFNRKDIIMRAIIHIHILHLIVSKQDFLTYLRWKSQNFLIHTKYQTLKIQVKAPHCKF